jgi:hypothetical protein
MASAASITITFAGDITALDDPNQMFGYKAPDWNPPAPGSGSGSGSGSGGGKITPTSEVVGTLTYDPVVENGGSWNIGHTSFSEDGSFNLGKIHTTGSGTIESTGSPLELTFDLQGSTNSDTKNPGPVFIPSLALDFTGPGGSAGPLTSLSDLTSYFAALTAGTGEALLTDGKVQYSADFVLTSFSVSASPSPTPIPPALPLFVSALGGLGFIGWKRRRTVTGA